MTTGRDDNSTPPRTVWIDVPLPPVDSDDEDAGTH